MIYLKKFIIHNEYNVYINGQNKILPNVSYCEDQKEVYYNPYPKVIAKFNITNISSPTYILYNYSTGISSILSNISQIEIDGIVQESVSNTYQFDTIGEHVVKYTLTDPTTMPSYSKYQYGVTTYYGMFNDCGRLTSVTIPPTVTTFNGAFRSCWSLTSVTIPSSVTTIGSGAFSSCRGLTSVIIPSGVTRIEDYTFSDCSGLTSVTIPSGVIRIGQDAFYGCRSLRNITFPSSVTYIGSGCIYMTQGTNVTIEATTPPGLGYPNGMNSASHIYVPSESVEAYKAATNWSSYASKIEAIP